MAQPLEGAHAETTDGSRPSAPHFDSALATRHPLGAFSILASGDAFEMARGSPPREGPARARAYLDRCVRIELHGADPSDAERVRAEIVRLLSGNLQLVARLEVAKPIQIDLIPPGRPLAAYGYPRSAAPGAIGLFWDDADWPTAKIALRRERLQDVPQLPVHEMAHAVHYLALTQDERDIIYRLLLRTYGNRATVDEAFAIYSERELLSAFTAADAGAPGVYGYARKRWSEDHLFTRFVRNLYFPHKPLAGPKLGLGL